jgi:putative flavoprotein involved in K+ transport
VIGESPHVLVGEGPAGALAARFAADHGDRVKRRVLVDSHGLGRFRPLLGMMLRFLGVALRPAERGLAHSFRNYRVMDLAICVPTWVSTGRMAGYALDRFPSPSVRTVMRNLGFRCFAPIPPQSLNRIDVPPTPSWGATTWGCRCMSAETASAPVRVAAARDRGRPRRPGPRAARGCPGQPPAAPRPLTGAALAARWGIRVLGPPAGGPTPSREALMSAHSTGTERFETIVVGGGQAGLSVGYHLRRLGRPFLILDAGERVGDSWRIRWDSLRLFTPAWADALTGMPFPAPRNSFPSKDEMANYLEYYATRFELPVRLGVTVDHLSRRNGRFLVSAGAQRWEADHVVVAMSTWQQPTRPAYAAQLDPNIVQMHSAQYRNPAQLGAGDVLVVGAGNSGAEVALDIASTHRTWLSGRHPGHLPFRIEGPLVRAVVLPLVLRLLFHRVLTLSTPPGRKLARHLRQHGLELVRTKPADLIAAGIQRTPRVVGVRDGLPQLEGGQVLNIATIIWATGYRPGYSWIDLPVLDEDGYPVHQRGIAIAQPQLVFVGFPFAHSASSGMVHGLGRDARYVAAHIAALASDHQRTEGWPTEETGAQRTELPSEHLGYESHPTPP